jgi:hypothetical protein
MNCKHIFSVQTNNSCKKCGLKYIPGGSHVHCWDHQIGRCIGCPMSLSHLGCKHQFVTGIPKKSPSSLGTHYSHCRYCFLNYFAFIADETERLVLEGIMDRKTFHIHCFDSDNGRCIATSPSGTCSHRVALL